MLLTQFIPPHDEQVNLQTISVIFALYYNISMTELTEPEVQFVLWFWSLKNTAILLIIMRGRTKDCLLNVYKLLGVTFWWFNRPVYFVLHRYIF